MSFDEKKIRLAMAAAERPEELDPVLKGREGVLRLAYGPAFYDGSFAWAIVLPGPKRAQSTAVMRQVSLRQFDYSVRDLAIDVARAEEWLAEAAAIRIPFISSRTLVLDGDTYRLSYSTHQTSLNLSWRSDGPVEWIPLTRWARSMAKRLFALANPEEDVPVSLV